MTLTVTDALEIVGALLLIVGVALFSVPVALVLAGLILIGAAFLLARDGRDAYLIKRREVPE